MALKLKYDVDASQQDTAAGESYDVYDGPVPPKGPYRVVLKFMTAKPTKKTEDLPVKEYRLAGVLEIDEKKGSEKSTYNGYRIWYGENITPAGAPYVNAMLDALKISRKAVWVAKAITVVDEDDPTVLKIGTKTVNDLQCRVNTGYETYNDVKRLKVLKWLPLEDPDDDEQWEDATDAATYEQSAEDEEEEGAEDEEEADPWTEEALASYDRAELVPFAREYEIKVLKKHTKEDLIALILEAQEAAQSADDVDEEEEEDDGKPPF